MSGKFFPILGQNQIFISKHNLLFHNVICRVQSGKQSWHINCSKINGKMPFKKDIGLQKRKPLADRKNSPKRIDKPGDLPQPEKQKTVANPEKAPLFSDTLKGYIKDVNHMQDHADQSIDKMATGKITDVDQVMAAVEEANTAFSLMMELRNKMLDAYREVMRMQM
jgi:flagellar hook-basal body complex protein FliE